MLHSFKQVLVYLIAFALLSGTAMSCSSDCGYVVRDGKIVYPVTPRPAEQQCMIGFHADPINTVRVGFIGLGMRGPGAVERFTYIEGG